MTYLARPTDFHAIAAHRPATQPRRRGLWRTLVDAITASQQRQAQRDIDRLVARTGKFTDSLEREIGERLMRSDWTIRS
jgi:hypothetical protein